MENAFDGLMDTLDIHKESVRFLIETLEDVKRNFSNGKKSEEKNNF